MTEPPVPEIRPACRTDIPGLLPLLIELCAGDAAAAAGALEAAMATGPPGHEAWVAAERTGEPVGFLALSPSGAPHFRLGFVEWVAVAPGARRRGIGRRLLACAEHRAAALGWRQLHACTFHTNRASLHMYIDSGFYPAATLHDYAGPGLHYVEMVRPLPQSGGGTAQ